MNNVLELRQLMKEHGLTYQDIAKLLRVSIYTVRSWLINKESDKYRYVSDKNITKLKRRLSKKAPNL